MAKAYLLIAFALFLSSPSALTAETADATANALIVVASRDLAAAESLSEPDVAGLMERLTLISSARSAVKKVLEEHDTSALAVRIALGEIPKLSLKSLDAALQESRVSLAQGITRCPDQRACLLNLAEGIAYKLVDAKARSRAFSGMSIGLRDVSRMPKVISFIKSNSTLSQSDIDTQTGSFLLEFANVLAVDGQVETAVSVLENIPESERSWTIPSFATNLLDLGNFDAAARLAEHPSLDAVGRDALAGHLLIFSAQMGDSDAAVFWLKQFIGSADWQRGTAAEVAALSGDAALASIIISSMPAGRHKASAEIVEAGANRDVVRLKKFADQVNATKYSPLKADLLTEVAAQFYFLGDNTMGDQLGLLASSRDDVQSRLVDLYIQTDQIPSAIDAAERISDDSQRRVNMADVAVAILAQDGLAAAQRYVADRGSPSYILSEVFSKLKDQGRLAEAVDYGTSHAYLADEANYLSAMDLGRLETLEAALLRVLAIKDPATKVAALAALAYKFDR